MYYVIIVEHHGQDDWGDRDDTIRLGRMRDRKKAERAFDLLGSAIASLSPSGRDAPVRLFLCEGDGRGQLHRNVLSRKFGRRRR